MKLCRYNEGSVGWVDGHNVYPVSEALTASGLPVHASMEEIIAHLVNHPGDIAKITSHKEHAIDLSKAHLLSPLINPPQCGPPQPTTRRTKQR